jgi:hypothetical protein
MMIIRRKIFVGPSFLIHSSSVLRSFPGSRKEESTFLDQYQEAESNPRGQWMHYSVIFLSLQVHQPRYFKNGGDFLFCVIFTLYSDS